MLEDEIEAIKVMGGLAVVKRSVLVHVCQEWDSCSEGGINSTRLSLNGHDAEQIDLFEKELFVLDELHAGLALLLDGILLQAVVHDVIVDLAVPKVLIHRSEVEVHLNHFTC